jgi:spore coat polysaccharide biosynthesis protein SpsF
MGSSRLPGKVLLDIAGRPMLARVVERTRRAHRLDEVVVATTVEAGDDPVAEFCTAQGYACTRGSLHDVLDRYYQAARQHCADVIVRITADCPLIDPSLIDLTVDAFLGDIPVEPHWKTNSIQQSAVSGQPSSKNLQPATNSYAFAANRLPPPWGRTYPIGLDVEVCTLEALEMAWQEASLPHQREHVMPFFYDHLERFRILLVNHPVDYGALRWTVDTPADLDLVRRIFAHFPGRDDFSWLEILELVQSHPELAAINAGVPAKDYRQVDSRR